MVCIVSFSCYFTLYDFLQYTITCILQIYECLNGIYVLNLLISCQLVSVLYTSTGKRSQQVLRIYFFQETYSFDAIARQIFEGTVGVAVFTGCGFCSSLNCDCVTSQRTILGLVICIITLCFCHKLFHSSVIVVLVRCLSFTPSLQ